MTYQPTKADIANEGAYLAQNMQVIGAGKNSSYRIFKNLVCGHEQEKQTEAVRKGLFHCNVCLNYKWHQEASDAGLTLHETFFKNGQTRGRYTFNSCGHESTISCCHVRKKSFDCQICRIKKWHQEASEAGLTFLGKVDNKKASYKIESCGHEQIFHTGHIKNNKFRCQICLDQKLRNDANSAGLSFIEKIDCDYALYKFNSCGHNQVIDRCAVRIGNFKCQTCEETWATRPSNLYLHLIEYGTTTLLKFGRARNVEKRSVQYGLPVGSELKILQVWPTSTGIDADRIETIVSKKFKRYNKSKAKLVLQDSGWTECYNIDDEQAIIGFVEQELAKQNCVPSAIGLH